MTSSPSPRTQRRYGVSFSVANFLARSSETVGLVVPGVPVIRGSHCAQIDATLTGKGGGSTAAGPARPTAIGRAAKWADRPTEQNDAVRPVRPGPARNGWIEG